MDLRGLIRLMVGRELEEEYPHVSLTRGAEVLRVEGVASSRLRGSVSRSTGGRFSEWPDSSARAAANSRGSIFGADRKAAGRIFLEGLEVAPRSPREAIDLGIALLTEDRNRFGLIPDMTVKENITLADLREFARGPFIRRTRERPAARRLVERLRIRPPGIDRPVAQLSGGNRQKVVLARWLLARSRVLIFDEPTSGVDVGGKWEIYNLINSLAQGGTAIADHFVRPARAAGDLRPGPGARRRPPDG